MLVPGALCLLFSCTAPPSIPERPESTAATDEDSRGFDPLELSRDSEIVPAEHPRRGSIVGRQELVEVPSSDPFKDSVTIPIERLNLQIDTLNQQAFRVQIFTTKLFSEAQRAVEVAEEIFDQPAYVDYEVPYFKVRVGSFANRDDAESYQQKTKASGYTNAWVVMVNLGVKEAAPLYDDLTGPSPPGTRQPVDTAESEDDQN